jgi:hypothetical protein
VFKDFNNVQHELRMIINHLYCNISKENEYNGIGNLYKSLILNIILNSFKKNKMILKQNT